MIHSFGQFELDEQRFELRRRGKAVELPRRVLETIIYLVQNSDRLISKDELLEGPWKGTNVSDAALSRSIMLARRALSNRAGPSELIRTVRGKGYRFVADVGSGTPSQHENGNGKQLVPVKGTRGSASSSPPPPPLFGRQDELKRMTAALDAAIAGRGGVVLVGGEPGIGKTTLLQALASKATKAEVLWGRCWEGDGAPAFWPWLEIIRTYSERHGARALATMGPNVFDIALLLPELRSSLPKGAPLPTDRDDAQARFRTFDSISQFLGRAAVASPMVLLIDDLHAADDASVLLLQYLARFIESSRVLVVASYRDLEVRSRPVLASLLGGPVVGAGRISLSGLADDDVGALLASHLGEPTSRDVVRRVRHATDGNPFLVGELARALGGAGGARALDASAIDAFRIPDRVAMIIQRHVETLPASSAEVLSTASVIGREFNLTLLAELRGCSPEEIVSDLEPAVLEGFVRDVVGSPGTSRFSHALICETLYQHLPTVDRLALHFGIAERLEQRLSDGTAKRDPRVFHIAHHYFAAVAHNGSAKAVEWMVKAGAQASELFGYELAAEHYSRALQVLAAAGGSHTQRCEILLRLAEAQALAGQTATAIQTFEKVEAVGRDHSDARYVARGLLGCSDTLRDGAVIHPTLAFRLEEALQMLSSDDSILRVRLLAAIPIAGLFQPSMTKRLGAFCEEAVAIARRLGDQETLARALHAANWRMMGDGTPPENALPAASEMIEVARQANQGEKTLDGHLWRAYYLQQLGRYVDFEADEQEHARLAKLLHHPLHLWWAGLAACARELRMGHLNAGEDLARKALGEGAPLQGLHADAVFAAQMLTSAFEKDGEPRRQAMTELAETTKRILAQYPPLLGLEGIVAVTEAELVSESSAKEIFERLVDDELDKAPRDQNLVPSKVLLSRLARDFGDIDRSRILYERLLPRAGRHVVIANVAGYWGPVSHHLGLLAATMSQHEMAVAHFGKAVEESRAASAPVWKAWAEYELGTLLRATERTRATKLLRSSLATAKRLELPRLARCVAAEIEDQANS